jgi:hypothetical protein
VIRIVGHSELSAHGDVAEYLGTIRQTQPVPSARRECFVSLERRCVVPRETGSDLPPRQKETFAAGAVGQSLRTRLPESRLETIFFVLYS